MRFAGTRVFLTGGTGFIGSHLVRRLVAEGARVTVLSREPGRARALSDLGVELVKGNVRDAAFLDLKEQDIVVHSAAWVGMGIPAKKRKLFWDTNVTGTANVLEAARRADVPKVVHVSSIAALPRGAANPGRPAVESDFVPEPEAFASFYSESKTAAHRLADESGIHVALPMPGIVLGPGGPFEPLFRRLANGRLPALPADDEPKGWVHVEDTVDGILLAALRGSGPYILVDDCVTTGELLARLTHEVPAKMPRFRVRTRTLVAGAAVVEKAYHLVGKTPPVSRELVASLAEPMRYDSTRARKDLGWSPDMWRRLGPEVRALREPSRKEKKAREEAAAREAKDAKRREKAAAKARRRA